ncbi:Hypothetical protein SRAE_2000363400 [Strongyloides ratti]|uniref:Uncharacterized protein n=1 Tax=Strongyloides ratti TaxID=34506 RepID=A0A090LGQ5_STRRB|nr:Hypothetical protein SRAE_2000363400 [Strongyloides ratti]CEF68981.1 Hypothetical protein SRAE_2000363400 [Strongyloides ratti]
MDNNNVLKIQLINQSEKERLLASERQRRRLLRMKEAKEQANIFSKLNRENKNVFSFNNPQKQQYNKLHKNHRNKITSDGNICPRLERYYQFLERNEEYNHIFNKYTTKLDTKTSNKINK